MTDAQDELAEQIFLQVVELGTEERTRLLDELAPDPGLRCRVERFLAWDASVPDGFLSGEDGANAVEPGARIGPYRVLERLGEGGMGTVYAVRQSFPRRDVALKVMRPGRVTEDALRRFRYEIDVLGRLQHVGIARIYDAGVIEGEDQHGLGRQVPYFTMELVRGVPLVAYARERALDLRARVELLARVADAVHYAHQHGVIHRDLKSDNVLVTIEESTAPGTGAHPQGVGQPKILDFGIARAVEPGDLQHLTVDGALLGTLSAMSPEQAAGSNALVDVRSDVYALGAMFYELLAGRPALKLDGLSVPQIARRIAEEQPVPLGDLDPVLRGDLTIVAARALEKDPERRYPSALDLASDLRRFLQGEPIEARADSRLYLLRRSLRRHRFAIGAAVVISLLTVAFAITSTLQARDSAQLARAEAAARRHSEQDFERALAAIDLLTSVAVDDLVEVPRAETARHKILEASLAFQRDLLESHGPSEQLRGRSAAARLRLGKILDQLGRQAEAREQLEQAVGELEQLDTVGLEVRSELSSALVGLSNALAEDGELQLAGSYARKAVELLLARDLDASTPKANAVLDRDQALLLSGAARNLSVILAHSGRREEALEAIRLALGPLERIVAQDPSPANRAELLRLLDRFTRAQIEAGRDEDLELRYAEAVEIGEDLVEAEPDSATYLSDLVGLLANRGIYLGQLGQTDAMRADFERSVELGEALLSDHPGLVDRLEVFALACNNLATARSDEGLHEEALDLTRRARELHQEILERAPSALRLGELGFVECNLGSLLSFLGQYDEAIEVLDAGTGHLDQALVSVPDRFDFVAAREVAHLHFGQAWIGLGDEERAVEAIAPLQASSDWRIVSRALDVYQGAVERVEGQAGHEDAEGVLGSYLDASASYLLACLEAGLQPPPVLGDPARYGVLLGYAPFEDAVRAGLR